MAEINVKIKGDDEDIKRKFRESERAGAEFSAAIKEQFAGLKETMADIAGEAGFGGLKKVLSGLGTVAIGAAIVDEFKKAGQASIDFEKQVTGLKLSLPAAFSGSAEYISKWVESISGAMGSFDENMQVMRQLLQSGMGIDQAKSALIDLQNGAMKLGISVADLGKSFAEIKSLGEVPERFWKEFPGLAPIARGLGMPEKPSAQWMLGTLLPNIAPGGLQAPGRLETSQTAAGQLADLGEEFKKLEIELGTELLPSIKDFANWLKSNLPAITESLKGFATGLEQVLQTLGHGAKPVMDFFGSPAFKRPEGPLQPLAMTAGPANVDWMKGVWLEMVSEFSEATKHHEQNASLFGRAMNPQRQ